MCIGEGIGGNGRNVEQREYSNNNIFKDEWIIRPEFSLNVNVFYDNSFNVRYSSGYNLANQFKPFVEEVYSEIFNLTINYSNPTLIRSTPDNCKIHRGLTLNSSTINGMCPANPSLSTPNCSYFDLNATGSSNCENCTSWYQVYRDFIEIYPGNDTNTSVLISGSYYYDDSGSICNRSYRWYDNGLIIQRVDTEANYYNKVLPVIIHEIAHDVGASDHYHEILTNPDGSTYCRGGDLCITCNPTSGRDDWCIMRRTSRTDLLTCSMDYIFCSGCKKEIEDHLNEHHYK